jgi:hypothetical protein
MPDNTEMQGTSYIRDGDELVTDGLTLDSFKNFLVNSAFRYEGENRLDRAAGLREAAAAFDHCYKVRLFER